MVVVARVVVVTARVAGAVGAVVAAGRVVAAGAGTVSLGAATESLGAAAVSDGFGLVVAAAFFGVGVAEVAQRRPFVVLVQTSWLLPVPVRVPALGHTPPARAVAADALGTLTVIATAALRRAPVESPMSLRIDGAVSFDIAPWLRVLAPQAFLRPQCAVRGFPSCAAGDSVTLSNALSSL